DIRDVRDVGADKPTLLEGEFDMKARHVIVLNGWTLPAYREAFAPGFKGEAGLAVQWIEIEGPFDTSPTAGDQSLVADLPVRPRSVVKALPRGGRVPPEPMKRNDGWWIYDPPEPASAKPREEAERLMKSFLPRAFRRPVSDDLVAYYVKMVHTALDRKMS